jgi:hypothetical protein
MFSAMSTARTSLACLGIAHLEYAAFPCEFEALPGEDLAKVIGVQQAEAVGRDGGFQVPCRAFHGLFCGDRVDHGDSLAWMPRCHFPAHGLAGD